MKDDFEGRLSALEVRVDAEARLRASVDSDLSVLEERQKRTLELVRDIQIAQTNHFGLLSEQLRTLNWRYQEHGLQLADLRKVQLEQAGKLDTQAGKLDKQADKLDQQADKLDKQADKLDKCAVRLDVLEGKVDRVLALLEPPAA